MPHGFYLIPASHPQTTMGIISIDAPRFFAHAAVVKIPLKAERSLASPSSARCALGVPQRLRRYCRESECFARLVESDHRPAVSHSELKSHSVATRTCLDEEAARDEISLGNDWKMQCRGDWHMWGLTLSTSRIKLPRERSSSSYFAVSIE